MERSMRSILYLASGLALSVSMTAAASARLLGVCTSLDDLIDHSDVVVVATIAGAGKSFLNGWAEYPIQVTATLRGSVDSGELAVGIGESPYEGSISVGRSYLLFLARSEGRYAAPGCIGDRVALEPDIAVPGPELSVRDRVLRLMETNLACREQALGATYAELERFRGTRPWSDALDDVIFGLTPDASEEAVIDLIDRCHPFTIRLE